jgi:hypothetical protein
MRPLRSPSQAWFAASAALATAAAAAMAVAIAHILETAQRGVICGVVSSGLEHCWACYATPMLALAAIAAWRAARSSAPAPARAR